MHAHEQHNVAAVRRFIDRAVNHGDLSVIHETWTENLAWHGGSLGTYRGRDELKAFMAQSASGAWENMHLEIDDVIASGDQVVLRFTNSGTNIGPFIANPATGKQAKWLGIGIYTLREGRIVEGWFAEDILGMLIQLGLLTAPT
jgi:predicted ester cyclase